ncbi:MAG: S49 family peptidase, partial [bacterium]
MKAFIRTFFATLLAMVVLLAIIAGVIGSKAGKKPQIKDGSYLVVDVYGDIPPYDAPGGVMNEILGGDNETLHRILSNLDKVPADDRIKGVIFKVSSSNNLGMAAMEEIRGAIKKVRDSGKKVVTFSDSMDRNTLYLASACDSIYMPVTGNFMFVGFGSGAMYVKNTLDKLGIKVDLHKIADYKSAAEMVTRTDMSPDAREMRNWIMDDLWAVGMNALSEDRGLSEEKINELMEYALFTAQEAKDAGLIDDILYWDELEARLRGEDDEELATVSQKAYAGVEREK